MTRILVVRRGGLGDTLLMTPLLRALRRLHPVAELHFAGVLEFVEVLAACGVVDVALSSEDFAFWAPARLRRQLAPYDLCFGDESGCPDGVLDVTALRTGEPVARQLAWQLGLELIWPDDARLAEPTTDPARAPGATSVLLSPGSGGAAKCWPRECWLTLAELLADRGLAISVLVGPTEIERHDPRRWPWPDGTRFVVEPRPAALVPVIAAADHFIGNDSGPTHLAAMLGLKTVAVFFASDPQVWAPVGPHVQVVGRSGQAPSVDEVERALDATG